ncbi:MAG TPA: substrate-binding domain-containing protein, partial [Candidatus Limnocylindrales bacterium]|nr:substrate-binding domain-containing protein [Candidatus Limnocylindrales bacterium]
MHQSKKPCPAMPVVVALLAAAMFFMAGCIGKTVPGVTSPETADNAILLATGTSVYDSGLLEFLNQVFTAQTGIEVRVASQGTGAALESGRRGDVDVVLVHDRITELILVEAGYFVDRYDVIYNDFILVGPASDPAGVRNAVDVFDAFNLIARSEYPFISRGDDSGANRKELRLWAGVGINPKNADWYFSIGQGMGDT